MEEMKMKRSSALSLLLVLLLAACQAKPTPAPATPQAAPTQVQQQEQPTSTSAPTRAAPTQVQQQQPASASAPPTLLDQELGRKLQAALEAAVASPDTKWPGAVLYVRAPGLGAWSGAAGLGRLAPASARWLPWPARSPVV